MSIKNGVDSAYIARCHKVLREWGAPLSDWHCVYVYDMADDDGGVYDLATCELCGCSKVRYVHVMRHDQYFEDIEVGCICAGIMWYCLKIQHLLKSAGNVRKCPTIPAFDMCYGIVGKNQREMIATTLEV